MYAPSQSYRRKLYHCIKKVIAVSQPDQSCEWDGRRLAQMITAGDTRRIDHRDVAFDRGAKLRDRPDDQCRTTGRCGDGPQPAAATAKGATGSAAPPRSNIRIFLCFFLTVGEG
jgi:hypothetical protein